MIKIYEFEDKKEELLLEKAKTELSCEASDLITYKKEIEGGFLKSKKYYLKVVKKEDIKLFIKEYFKEISNFMNLDINSEVNEKDKAINIMIVSSNNSVLIGKDGRTLKSLQVLLKQAIKAQTGFNVYLNMDIGGYKKSKQKKLEYIAKKTAKEVLYSKVDAKLDPMNSYERRLVHSIVSEFEGLTTVSEGEDPNRYVIIKYSK